MLMAQARRHPKKHISLGSIISKKYTSSNIVIIFKIYDNKIGNNVF